MNTVGLREYIKKAYEMEEWVYEQEQLIQVLQREKDSLPKRPDKQFSEPIRQSGYGCLVSIITVVVGFLMFYNGADMPGSGISLMLGFGGLGVIVIGCVAGKNAWGKEMDYSKSYKWQKIEYEKAQTQYDANIKQYKKALPHRMQLEAEISAMQKPLQDSRRLLQSFYDCDVIYPKYRNLIAVSSFYDYLMSGRCDRLEGHDGAYNLFEMEVRMDRIIVQLDMVIAKLEQIRQNQYMLYQAVQKSNQQIARLRNAIEQQSRQLSIETAMQAQMNHQLGQIRRSSETQAYEAERTRRETEFQTWLMRMR